MSIIIILVIVMIMMIVIISVIVLITLYHARSADPTQLQPKLWALQSELETSRKRKEQEGTGSVRFDFAKIIGSVRFGSVRRVKL